MTLLIAGLGSSGVISSANGGKVTAVNNLGTAATQVVPPNPQRQSITFANPGTVTVYVGPTTNAQGATISPTLAALGGMFPVFAGGLLTITGECQQAYQALAASGSGNPLTVMESNL